MMSIFSFIFLMMLGPMASATMTFISGTGYSNIDITSPTLPIIYGGFAGECAAAAMDGVNTCNSCANATGFTPCNTSNVYPSLTLNLTFQSTVALNLATIAVTDGSNNNYTIVGSNPQTTYGANSSIPISILWSSICQFNAAACESGTDGSVANLTLTITVTSQAPTTGTGTAAAATSDTMTVNLIFRYVLATGSSSFEYYTPCTSGGAQDTTSGDGMCGFTLFPGDQKAYVTEADFAAGYPSTGAVSGSSGSTNYTGVVFFYASGADQSATTYDGANDLAIINTITSASPNSTISIDNTQTPAVLGDDRIQGMSNNLRYCVAFGNQDLTGIISNMTPLPSTTSPVAATAITSSTAYTYCAEPSKVVGLLDDKHCFIATAAWGSNMAPQVQSFREFRNQYMLPFAWGRTLITEYYRHGPRYARMIAANDTLRMVARTALWPPLIFAKVAVNLGIFPALLMLLTCAFLLWEFSHLLRRKKPSGEL